MSEYDQGGTPEDAVDPAPPFGAADSNEIEEANPEPVQHPCYR